jgi:hypothetical protein
VFITFTMSLLGLSVHWVRARPTGWVRKLSLSAVGFVICLSILCVTLWEKTLEGGWMTVIITGVVIIACLMTRRHYNETHAQIAQIDRLFVVKPVAPVATPPRIDRNAPTAVFLVSRSLGTGMHSLLWVARLFPGQFKNMVFVSAGEVDFQSFGGEAAVQQLEQEVKANLAYYVNYCHSRGIAAASYQAFGTDPVAQLSELCETIAEEYPSAIFFASKLIFVRDNWWTRLLHNQTAVAMQRRLHLKGRQMVILPMKID